MSDLTLFQGDKLDSAVKAATMLSKSKIIPYALQGKVEDIFAILCMGQELGLAPMQALNSVNLIQGKTCISPQLMMAMVRSKLPGCVLNIKRDDANKKATVTAARSKQDLADGLFYESTWDMDRAKAMGLAGKDNYQKQAVTMLVHRACAEACRMVFSDIILGLYAPEEFQDFDGKTIETASVKSMIDEDFPIDPKDLEVGDNYLVQNGKFRGKRFGEIGVDALCEYREEMIKRGAKKDWEQNLISVIAQYANMKDD
jgi:hypothetical protein